MYSTGKLVLLLLLACLCIACSRSQTVEDQNATTRSNAAAAAGKHVKASLLKDIKDSPYFDKNDIKKPAIAISGGGSRSLILATGYFRALQRLGNLGEKAGVISSVSGGSWFNSIFTFQDKYNNSELLGESTSVENLTLEALSCNKPGKLLEETLLTKTSEVQKELMAKGVKSVDLYQAAINEIFLKPFALHNTSKYLAMNELQVTQILKDNPDMSREQFLYPKENSPNVIFGGTLLAPLGYEADESNAAYLQMTPGYIGTPYGYTGNQVIKYHSPTKISHNTYKPAMNICALYQFLNESIVELQIEAGISFDKAKVKVEDEVFPGGNAFFGGSLFDYVKNQSSFLCVNKTGFETTDLISNVGGGLLEAFAFGGERLSGSTYAKSRVSSPTKPFSLGQAIGVSSMAQSGHLAQVGLFQNILPRAVYWPASDDPASKQLEYQMGDGGNIENTGLLTLLSEGAKKIMVMVNTEEVFVNASRVDLCSSRVWKNATMEEVAAWGPSHIANKFGVQSAEASEPGSGTWFMYNQVFKFNKYRSFMCKAQRLIAEGKPVIFNDRYKLVDNSYWKINGGSTVDIMWVVNAKSENFEMRLPSETQKQIDSETGNFLNFPYYPTMFPNGEITTMTLPQMNLLAAQAEYAVNENAALIQKWWSHK